MGSPPSAQPFSRTYRETANQVQLRPLCLVNMQLSIIPSRNSEKGGVGRGLEQASAVAVLTSAWWCHSLGLCFFPTKLQKDHMSFCHSLQLALCRAQSQFPQKFVE